MQQCHENYGTWFCTIKRHDGTSGAVAALSTADVQRELLPSFTVNSTAGKITELADEITATASEPGDQVQLILDWLDENIQKEVVDSFNSLDVLAQRKAECQGHSMLFAALARSLGIPTRLINGVVYSQEYKGFLYHTWVESYIDDQWQAIDPTFGQRHADATHIALIEGEALADLTALLPLIGRLEIELE